CESTSVPTDSAGVGPQDLVAVTWTRRLSSALRTPFYATVLPPSQCYSFSWPVSFPLRFERVDYWERIASRGDRPSPSKTLMEAKQLVRWLGSARESPCALVSRVV